jgi:RNA polymerase sigma-70 factor (ECF subfamily)
MNFESVFRDHRARVTRTLASLGVQSAFVEDAVQDVFLIVYQKLAEFEGRAQLKTWIYAVTYRVAQNYRRRLKLRTHEPFEDNNGCPQPNPAQSLENVQAARFVELFCASLSEAKRDVFVLCILEERCAPEVSEILNLNLNTVYSRARTARLEFRQALSNLSRREERYR